MSAVRVRQWLVLACLGLLLVVKAQQPGPIFALGSTAKGFPEDVTVTASPAPNIYADNPELRVLQLLSSMNVMWERAFRAAGDEYERPRVEARKHPTAVGCGAGVPGWAGIYCSRGKRIVIDISNQLVLRAATGDERSDDLLGYVIAHEVGHHVQALRGVAVVRSQQEVRRTELHAQCLAGVWGRAAGRALPPLWSYGADGDHGSVGQQRVWLETGYRGGRPSDCDAVWSRDV